MEMQNSTSSSRSLARKLPIVIAALALVAVGAFFLMKQTGVDKAVVRQQVDQFAGRLDKTMQQQGLTSSLLYDDVEVDQHGASLQVTLKNASLTFSPLQGAVSKNDNLTFATEKVIFQPESLDFNEYRLLLPTPVVASGQGNSVRISYDSPPEYAVSRAGDGVDLEFVMPAAITIAAEPLQGEPVRISLDQGAKLGARMDENYRVLQSFARMGNVSIEMAAGMPVTIKSLDSRVENTPVGGGSPQYDMASMTVIDDLLIPMNPYGAIDMTVDSVLRIDPAVFENPEALTSVPQFSLNLKNVDISLEQFGIALSGQLQNSESDPIPAGEGKVRVRRFDSILQEMERFGALGGRDKQKLGMAIQKVTGKAMDSIEDLEFAISRKPGESVQIGGATMEELMMLSRPDVIVGRPSRQ